MKVLCAINGSRHSQWAMDWLNRLCSPRRDSLLLVHAVDLTQFKRLPRLDQKARSVLVKVLEFSLEGAVRLLEGAELKAAQSWSQVQAKLLRGHPAQVVASAAKRECADLLVIGWRGVTEFQSLLLGSVSRRLVAQAPCSVLVVKSPAKTIRRIVVGVDGSVESWEAVASVKSLPLERRPGVTVATVMPLLPLERVRLPAKAMAVVDQVQGVLRREAQKLATRAAETLRQAGFSAKAIVLSGPPGAELVKLAECEQANLVVVGSWRGRSPHEYFMGSVADTVVKHVPCSVLVCRT